VVVRGARAIVLQKPDAPHEAIRGLAERAYPARYLEKERRDWD
jgi:hypothetical protein